MPTFVPDAPAVKKPTFVPDAEAAPSEFVARQPADAEIKAYEPSVARRIIDALNDSDFRTQVFGPSTNTLLKQAQSRASVDNDISPQSVEERGAIPSVLSAARQPLAMTARILPALLASEGGPMGFGINAAGEAAGQLIEPRERMSPQAVLAQEEKPLIDKGRVAEAGIVGAIPLGSTKSVFGAVKNAAKLAGGGYAGEQVRSVLDEGKPSDRAAEQAGLMGALSLAVPVVAKILGIATKNVTPEVVAEVEKAIRNNAETAASIEKITSKGGVINPASQNPTVLNKTLGSVAGLQNIKNKMVEINAPVLDDIARAEAGLLPTDVINEDALKVARSRIMAPLNEIRGLGLQKEVDAWDAANQTRQDLLEQRTNGTITPAAFRSGMADVQSAMSSVEQTIDRAVTAANKPELVGILPDIKERLAKNYDVRRLTPTGTGHVDAGRASGMAAQRVENPETMTGGLRDIANFSNAAYGASGDVNKIAPHSGTLGPHAALGAVALGEGPKAALSGGIMGLRGPLADLVLSPDYQAGKGLLGLLGAGAKRKYPLARNLAPKDINALNRVAAILAAQEEPDSSASKEK